MIYLAGMFIGIPGNILVLSVLSAPDRLASLSENGAVLATGAVLWLLTVVGDAAHGILMFPVLKQAIERKASGYLGFRIMDATFIAIMGLLILAQIPIGRLGTQAKASEAFHLPCGRSLTSPQGRLSGNLPAPQSSRGHSSGQDAKVSN